MVRRKNCDLARSAPADPKTTSARRPEHPTEGLYDRIYQRVRQVPAGRVTTYGAVGRVVGCPARVVGFAMAALPTGHDVPWHRVVNSQGRISRRTDGDGRQVQRLLLEKEGVRFEGSERVDLERIAWTFDARG